MNLQQEAYEQALSNMDKIIDLMEKKTELLKLHHADLMAYLEFLQSLKLK